MRYYRTEVCFWLRTYALRFSLLACLSDMRRRFCAQLFEDKVHSRLSFECTLPSPHLGNTIDALGLPLLQKVQGQLVPVQLDSFLEFARNDRHFLAFDRSRQDGSSSFNSAGSSGTSLPNWLQLVFHIYVLETSPPRPHLQVLGIFLLEDNCGYRLSIVSQLQGCKALLRQIPGTEQLRRSLQRARPLLQAVLFHVCFQCAHSCAACLDCRRSCVCTHRLGLLTLDSSLGDRHHCADDNSTHLP